MRTRGARSNIKAVELAKLLGKAGWTWRHGHGSHLVVSKPGERNITLADPISKNQWMNAQKALQTHLGALLGSRPRGRHGRRINWEERFQRALEVHRVGFGLSWTLTQTGLASIRKAHPEFTPELIEALGVEEAVRLYAPTYEVYKPSAPKVEVRTEAPQLVPMGVRSEAPIEHPIEHLDDMGALLSIMGELKQDVRELITGRAERASAYAERLLRLRRHLEAMRKDTVTHLDEMLEDLREF